MLDTLTVDSRPYRWPWHGRLDPRRTALVVCTGDLRAALPPAPLERLAVAIGRCREAGVSIMWLPAAGTEPPPPLVMHGDLVSDRPCFGGFTGTALDLALRVAGRSDLLVAGAPFELGADCTMREANDLGYECLLLEDCSAGLSAETFAGAVRSAQMSGGIFGAVAGSDALLAALRLLARPACSEKGTRDA